MATDGRGVADGNRTGGREGVAGGGDGMDCRYCRVGGVHPVLNTAFEGVGGVEKKEVEGTEAPQMRMAEAEGRRSAGGRFMSDCEAGPSVFPVVLLMAWC